MGEWVWDNEHGRMSMGEWAWENEYGRMSMGEWAWENEYGRMSVGEWIWENECGRMSMGEWAWENEHGRMSVRDSDSLSAMIEVTVVTVVSRKSLDQKLSVGETERSSYCCYNQLALLSTGWSENSIFMMSPTR